MSLLFILGAQGHQDPHQSFGGPAQHCLLNSAQGDQNKNLSLLVILTYLSPFKYNYFIYFYLIFILL